jgi:hypothetical protein
MRHRIGRKPRWKQLKIPFPPDVDSIRADINEAIIEAIKANDLTLVGPILITNRQHLPWIH